MGVGEGCISASHRADAVVRSRRNRAARNAVKQPDLQISHLGFPAWRRRRSDVKQRCARGASRSGCPRRSWARVKATCRSKPAERHVGMYGCVWFSQTFLVTRSPYEKVLRKPYTPYTTSCCATPVCYPRFSSGAPIQAARIACVGASPLQPIARRLWSRASSLPGGCP